MSDMRRRVRELWTAVFGEPPAVDADPQLMCELLVRHLPPAPPYGNPPCEPEAGEPSGL